MHRSLTVGRLARAAGVTAKTVRYYEALGLLPRAERAENGYRHYAGDSADRLAFIQRAKSLGLTLEEIRQLISTTDDARCDLLTPELQQLLARKLADCDRRIAELAAFRTALAGAAERLNAEAGSCADSDGCACSAYQQDCECLPAVTAPLDITVQGRV
jgi:MerR family transcriptional regulator, copper efflux regulator